MAVDIDFDVKQVNFRSKKERKAARKSLWKKGTNIAADRALDKEAKKDFIRKMRVVKLRRRKIATELTVLGDQLGWMLSDLDRTLYRYPRVDEVQVVSSLAMTRDAQGAVTTAAAEAWKFAARKIYVINTFGGR